ncbi:hypothetical protein E2C01_055929 [Portunus trituberculatus]|uniref:Uncharacterized protein n=1 Tax=Portunus trituberculatus TaxID=210409 RepID=A0A5B7GSR4_PORTR|nr:hypothetical protein [Portunus trituberculatus]
MIRQDPPGLRRPTTPVYMKGAQARSIRGGLPLNSYLYSLSLRSGGGAPPLLIHSYTSPFLHFFTPTPPPLLHSTLLEPHTSCSASIILRLMSLRQGNRGGGVSQESYKNSFKVANSTSLKHPGGHSNYEREISKSKYNLTLPKCCPRVTSA